MRIVDGYFTLISAAILALLSGCSTKLGYQETERLRIGMSRAEAIKIMGEPGTTEQFSAREEKLTYNMDRSPKVTDYMLNKRRVAPDYILARQGVAAPTQPSEYDWVQAEQYREFKYNIYLVDDQVETFGMLRRPTRREPLPPPCRVALLDAGPLSQQAALRITEVKPATAIVGMPTEFTITVAYSLVEVPDGTFSLSLNLQRPNEFQRIGLKHLNAGSGTLSCTVTVSPVDYGNIGDFTFQATLQKPNNQVVARHEFSVAPKQHP